MIDAGVSMINDAGRVLKNNFMECGMKIDWAYLRNG